MSDGRRRVVHVFKNYFPPTHGGIEHHIHDVAHGLADRFETIVLTAAAPGHGPGRYPIENDDDGVRVVRAPVMARISTLPVVPSWPRLLRSLEPDVVHFHLPNPTADALFAVSTIDVPCVATYHAEITRLRPLSSLYAMVQHRLLQRTTRVITTSDALASSTPSLRAHGGRVAVIPLGIDSEAWCTSEPTSSEQPVVLFVGRLVHYKGVDVLIEAMRGIDAKLCIVGDGSRRPALEALVRRNGLDGHVIFTGVVGPDELAARYHAASVVVLPSTSRAEGFGTVLLEAMACARPVVSTELGTGTSWVNVHTETGLVVPPGDARALGRAIADLLGAAETRSRMGENGRRRVQERFTRSRMLDALSDVYTSAIGSGARSP